MDKNIRSVIIGTGSYIPSIRITNDDFLNNEFLDNDGNAIGKTNEEIIKNFEKITGITERRYAPYDLVTSDIATHAAEDALNSSKVDRESLDYIIVAHNFGDTRLHARQGGLIPSLASRIKQKLGIKNPLTIPYDLPFGCPGWLQGVIQADYYLKSGDAKRAMVIGSETLSRVLDSHDRDSMLYADGAGATILEGSTNHSSAGIMAHSAIADTFAHAYLLRMDKSYNREYNGTKLFLKMDGHKVYEYAVSSVPKVVMDSLNKAGVVLSDVKKVLIHQANEKMDRAILKNLYKLYGQKKVPYGVMPMTISWLGNSSVATLPTLLDLWLKGKLEDHEWQSGDIVVFASIGAGMNVNSLVYKLE